MWEWLMSMFGGESGGSSSGGGGGGGGGGTGSLFSSIFDSGGNDQGGHAGSAHDGTGLATSVGQKGLAELGSVLGQAPQGGFDISSADAGSSVSTLLKQLMAGKGSMSNMRKGADVREQVLGDLYGVNNLNRMR